MDNSLPLNTNLFLAIQERSEGFLRLHSTVSNGHANSNSGPISGEFSLHRNQTEPDLYGMIDAVYILFTLGVLAERTNQTSRQCWAKRILECQDDLGWFSRRNHRGHSKEHATAYAIAALRLLEVSPKESYVDQMRPLAGILPLLTDQQIFLHWIDTLNFRLNPRDILAKNLGWHHIWRGSHIGGGVAASIGMSAHLFEVWWPQSVSSAQWFDWYFSWLQKHVNPETGYWQRAFWNIVYRKPTLIDMGGAVHFYWLYEAMKRPFPYPKQLINATLSLQKASGLYRQHPYCIDLDGNFCVARSYLQLEKDDKEAFHRTVESALESNFMAVSMALLNTPLEELYTDSHGLPGALAALTECAKFPNFRYTQYLVNWKHPLDTVCWL